MGRGKSTRKILYYVCKLREKDSTWKEFSKRLRYEIEFEHEIAINPMKIDRFINKWGILLHSLEFKIVTARYN